MLSNLKTIVGTAHENIQSAKGDVKLITPISDLTKLKALEEAHAAHPTGIPDGEITEKGWRIEWGDKCSQWLTLTDKHLIQIKEEGHKKLESLANNPEEAKHEAIKLISEMMARQMKGCGDVIKPPFQPYQAGIGPARATAAPRGSTSSEIFKPMCETSKRKNHISEIHTYVLDAFIWTVNDYIKRMPEHTIILNIILSSVEKPLNKAEQEYCKRPTNEINNRANRAAALEFCFNEYEKRVLHIVDMFLSTMKTVRRHCFLFNFSKEIVNDLQTKFVSENA